MTPLPPAPAQQPEDAPAPPARSGAPATPPSDAAPSGSPSAAPGVPPPAALSPSPVGLRIGLAVVGLAAVWWLLAGLVASPSAPIPAPTPVPVLASAPVAQLLPAPVPGAQRENPRDPEAGIFGIWTVEAVTTVPGAAAVSEYQTQLRTAEGRGCRIAGFLRPDTAGELLGLRRGDVLVTYAGQPTPSIAAVCRIHQAHHAGDPVTVEVVRDGALVRLHGPLGRMRLLGALGTPVPTAAP